jgi:hypothetical protein
MAMDGARLRRAHQVHNWYPLVVFVFLLFGTAMNRILIFISSACQCCLFQP